MNVSRSFTTLFALVALLSVAALPAGAKGKSALDGKRFKGELVEKGTKDAFKDDLVFSGGRFRSTACDKFGYQPTRYEAKGTGDKVRFEAEAKNGRGDTMKWKGRVKGREVKATAVMYKKGEKKAMKRFRYEGKLRA